MGYWYDAEIHDQAQWTKYTLKKDSHYGCYFNHDKPERFPVRVESEMMDDDDGRRDSRDCLSHTFTYRQAVKCDHCGETKIVWPDGGTLTT